MVSVTYRDGKGILIAGISLIGGASAVMWLLFLLLKNEAMPWWVWLIPATVTVGSFSLVGIFTAMLIGTKVIVSEHSLTKIVFRRRREIRKGEILAIVDMTLGKNQCYVVYPKGNDSGKLAKHTSQFVDITERTKLVQSDKRLLIFTKSKRMSQLLERFGYPVTMAIE